MSHPPPLKVGYVVKRYPRYSETFIVNEILAHEAAGLGIEIFSLRPFMDSHFQDAIARVRAPVHYVTLETVKLVDFWRELQAAGKEFPDVWAVLGEERDQDVRDVYQGILLARAVKRRGITHLHAHFVSLATTAARIASRLTGVPFTFTAHAKDIFHEDVRRENLGREMNAAAAVVTVSDFNLDYLRKICSPSVTRAQRIYNGLDLTRFAFDAPSNRPPLIVGLGRLVEKKGFSVLIDACAVLAKRNRPFTCQIIGTGELQAELRDQIERLDIGARVQLIGNRPQAEVIRVLQGAAVLAAPCIVGKDGNRDGMPTVLLESMALGTPCVSTNVTGIPECIRDGQTGLIVAQHNAEHLAVAIERLLDDANLRVQLATNARRLIEQEFDVHINAERLRKIFQSARELT